MTRFCTPDVALPGDCVRLQHPERGWELFDVTGRDSLGIWLRDPGRPHLSFRLLFSPGNEIVLPERAQSDDR